MHIITVIPLTRSKVGDQLSYFTSSEVTVGSIVSVPLRSKNIHAIVTDIRPAAQLKSDIKDASFQLKKLGKVKTTAFFPATFMDACKTLAEYYATTIGAVIDTLISDTLMEQAAKITMPVRQNQFFNEIKTATSIDETFAIQGDDEDRLGSWRSLIRQEFARKRSVVIYAPTVEDVETLSRALTKGIEGYIFILHSKRSKKAIIDTWKSITETTHPVVIVATGSFAIVPRSDIDTVIIERENSRGWIGQKQPYLDIRHALETIARRQKQTVYRADCLLRTETLHRVDTHEIAQGSPFKWRSISNARDILVDMRIDNVDHETMTTSPADGLEAPPKAPFRVLSLHLKELIATNQEASTHLFILTTRRGLSPITICSDCESIVSCSRCSAPMVLHTSKSSGKNFFMCHTCGERRDATEKCKTCDSWRLTPLGIGIDRVYEEIQKEFPSVDVFKIDADTTKTDSHVEASLEQFRAKPGSILLGTEMALLHITEKIDHVAIASLDSLFALPDFRIQEKIMYIITRLRSLASRSVLIQTRKADEKVFEYGLKGNLSDFYRSTLEDRKQFMYPPFSTLIKITIEGSKDVIAAAMAEVQHLLDPREIDVFPAFTATVRGNSIIHGLIKLPEGGWPNSDLIDKLRSLPPSVKIKIDPETLL
jgi:primosomal protein N' (replication factor Y)